MLTVGAALCATWWTKSTWTASCPQLGTFARTAAGLAPAMASEMESKTPPTVRSRLIARLRRARRFSLLALNAAASLKSLAIAHTCRWRSPSRRPAAW